MNISKIVLNSKHSLYFRNLQTHNLMLQITLTPLVLPDRKSLLRKVVEAATNDFWVSYLPPLFPTPQEISHHRSITFTPWVGGGTRERYRGCTGGDSDKALGNCCNLGFFRNNIVMRREVFQEYCILKIAIGKYKV